MAATRILVVEDEFLIALDIAGVLEQAGLAVIGPAVHVGDALQAIEQEVVHGALLDAHLAGGAGRAHRRRAHRARYPLRLCQRLWGREQLPQAYRGVPLVRKPFTGRDLLAAAPISRKERAARCGIATKPPQSAFGGLGGAATARIIQSLRSFRCF